MKALQVVKWVCIIAGFGALATCAEHPFIDTGNPTGVKAFGWMIGFWFAALVLQAVQQLIVWMKQRP